MLWSSCVNRKWCALAPPLPPLPRTAESSGGSPDLDHSQMLSVLPLSLLFLSSPPFLHPEEKENKMENVAYFSFHPRRGSAPTARRLPTTPPLRMPFLGILFSELWRLPTLTTSLRVCVCASTRVCVCVRQEIEQGQKCDRNKAASCSTVGSARLVLRRNSQTAS